MSSGSPAASEGGVIVFSKRPVGVLFVIMVAISVALVVGCSSSRPSGTSTATQSLRLALRKAQTPKEREGIFKPGSFSTVGETCKIMGVEPLGCSGLGLVSGLRGNGADKSNIDPRVLSDVKKALMVEEGRTLAEAKDLVEGRDSSIVNVVGVIAPGAPNGSAFDVYVQPVDSAVSLGGGYLHRVALQDYVTMETVSFPAPLAGKSEKKLQTIPRRTIAHAAGPVATQTQGADVIAADADSRTGVVFEGGRYENERILLLALGGRRASPNHALLIEYLINQRFGNVGRDPGSPAMSYATATTSDRVTVRVPAIYRKYVQRFADVLRHIGGSYYYGPPQASDLQKLASRLASADQKGKYEAATELEAVGAASISSLEPLVTSSDEWTAFYAAQTLAYLDDQAGADKVFELVYSSNEPVRFEAVKFAGQLAGRRAVQVLREKVLDTSSRVALEAVNGLVSAGAEAAGRLRLAQYDLVRVPGAPGGLIVRTTGRPLVVVVGLDAPLKGTVGINLPGVGIGSVDETRVGVIIGQGAESQSIEVDATADDLLTFLALSGQPFDTVRRVIQALEDGGNLPYKITWVD
jgi:hypothetical protein